MEKAKENYYQRDYKNLFNIISEIGGFTQSFIALGTLICLKYSSYNFNQELVNDLFSFENGQDQSQTKQPQIQYNNQDNLNNKERSNPNNQTNLHEHHSILKNTQNQQSIYSLSNYKTQQLNKFQQIQPAIKGNRTSIEETNHKLVNEEILNQDKFSSRQESLIILKNINSTEKDFNSIKLSQITFQNGQQQIKNEKIQNFKQNDKESVTEQSSPLTQFEFYKEQQSPQIPDQLKQSKPQDKRILRDIIDSYKMSFLQEDSISSVQNSPLKSKPLFLKNSKNISYREREIARQQQIHEVEFKKLTNFNLTAAEYIKSIIWPFGKSSRKKKIVEYTMNRLCYHFDIKNIIKKLMEIDKIKKVIFTSDQIKLLEYLPKPTIKYDLNNSKKLIDDDTSEFNNLYQDHRTDLQKAVDAYDSLNIITRKEKKSELDLKILSLIDQNLLQALCEKQNHSNQLQNGQK